jgi:drug/metabolite transporter (DMT)-like permease
VTSRDSKRPDLLRVENGPRDHQPRFDSLLIVIPGLIWGASFLFIAEGLQAVAPMGVTVVRIALGFATLSFVPAARRPIRPEDRAKTAALGVLWLAFPLSMFPFAEQHVSSALAGMLNGATPLLAALVASALERRAPSRRVAIGLAVGLAGAVLIALPGLAGTDTIRGEAPGVLMILAALVSYAFAYSLARPLQQRNGALPVVWRALGWALLLTAPFGAPAVVRAHWTAASLGSLLALGALGTGLAYAVLATAAGRLGATRASSNNFIIPVVSLLLGVLVRHERVSAVSIAGAGICLIGAWLIRPVAPIQRARASSTATS